MPPSTTRPDWGHPGGGVAGSPGWCCPGPGSKARPDSSGVSPGVHVQCAPNVWDSPRPFGVSFFGNHAPQHSFGARRMGCEPGATFRRRPPLNGGAGFHPDPSRGVNSTSARPVQPVEAGWRLDGAEDVVQRPCGGAALPPEIGKTESLHESMDVPGPDALPPGIRVVCMTTMTDTKAKLKRTLTWGNTGGRYRD